MLFCFLSVALLGTPPPVQASSAARRLSSEVRVDERSGRLVRVVVTRPAARAARQAPTAGPVHDLAAIIADSAGRHGVDPDLVHSVVKVESNYNALAVSGKGAQGLMQLMPGTARRFGVDNSFDPKKNVEGGVRYLRFLLDLYPRDLPRALAAYNAGEGAVNRFGAVPPYPETQSYVRKVVQRYKKGATPAPSGADASSGEPGTDPPYRPVLMSVDSQGRLTLRTP